MASDDNLFSFIYFFWSIVFRLVSSTISHLKEDKISFAEKYILPSKLHVFIPWKILFDLVRTHSASFDLSSADNLSRCVLKFHWTLFTPSLQIVFDHNIYITLHSKIYIYRFVSRQKTRICARKVKVKVILHCFNTTCVTQLNIARLYRLLTSILR